MSIFKRIKRVVKAKANKAVSLLENEEELLEQSINDMEKEFENLNDALIKSVTTEMDTKELVDEAEKKVKLYANRAKKAAEENKDDDVIKAALNEQYKANIEYEEYKKMYDSIKEQNDNLKEKVKEININLLKMNQKKDILITKIRVAKSQKSILDSYSSINPSSNGAEFNKIEKKIQSMENEVKATEIVQEELAPTSQKFDKMWEDDERESWIDQKMSELKNN